MDQDKALVKQLSSDGSLSSLSVQALQVVDLGAQVQNGIGISIDDVPVTELLLVTVLIDDSSSIRSCQNEQNVRDGHNLMLDAFLGAKNKDNILIMARTLNRGVLYPFMGVAQAPRLDDRNYIGDGSTPLYDETVITLATVLAKDLECVQGGVPARSATLLITDGADYGSRDQKPKSVASIVADMEATERHLVYGMGIDDGRTDFKQIFKSMGIDASRIYTPQDDPRAIRQGFRTFSQSALGLKSGGQQQSTGGGFIP